MSLADVLFHRPTIGMRTQGPSVVSVVIMRGPVVPRGDGFAAVSEFT
jgi:hypothetical protein